MMDETVVQNNVSDNEDEGADVGIVYVLTNPAMHGLVKIGRTKSDVDGRVKQMFTTQVPMPFECVYAVKVPHYIKTERALHAAFAPHRLPGREFFRIQPEQAIVILNLLKIKDVTPGDTQHEADGPDQVESGTSRGPNLTFDALGIPKGAKLKFPSADAEATVVDGKNKVQYDGQEYTLTPLTRKLLGVNYPPRPAPYWEYNGESLKDMYNDVHAP